MTKLLTRFILFFLFSAGADAKLNFTLLDDRNPYNLYSSTPIPNTYTLVPYTVPAAINNNGLILGSACCNFQEVPGDMPDVFAYSPAYTNLCQYLDTGNLGCTYSPFLNLGYLTPTSGSDFGLGGTLIGLNNQTTIIGNVYLPSPELVGFIRPGFFSQDYDTFLRYIYQGNVADTFLTAINDSGQITGRWRFFDGATGEEFVGGFLYQNGVFTDLPFIPFGINNRGQIVGTSGGDVVLSTNGKIRDLGVFPSDPVGINDQGVIVGEGYFYAGGKFTAVQVPGSFNTTATGINDAGTIVGSFQTADGTFGFAAAIPEPGYGALLFIGLAMLPLARRVRRAS